MISTKYKRLYDEMIYHYKNVHVNPWHNISEDELNGYYNKIVNSRNITDEYSFCYLMNYIIKRLSGESDAHTQYESNNLIPMNFKIFDDKVVVNYPDKLRGFELKYINGISVDDIFKELDEILTYGTLGRKKFVFERSLFNRNILLGLPSLYGQEELIFYFEKDGVYNTQVIPNSKIYTNEELFDLNEFRFGDIASYYLKDNYLIYNHRTLQNQFENIIKKTIERVRSEDLSEVDTIIIDIRGNTGGSSKLNQYLIEFLKEQKDKKLICLTDYRVFSGGRYALVDLINLGATTIGDMIATPLNCYGNNDWKEIDGHWFSTSSSYLHPLMKWSAHSKEEYESEVTTELIKPSLFRPDIFVTQTFDDFINGIDTVLEYALEYSKENKLK